MVVADEVHHSVGLFSELQLKPAHQVSEVFNLGSIGFPKEQSASTAAITPYPVSFQNKVTKTLGN